MIVQNEMETVKNLQFILDMTDIVVLYNTNTHVTCWVGFVKDLPIAYLHGKIVNIFMCDVKLNDSSFATVFIK